MRKCILLVVLCVCCMCVQAYMPLIKSGHTRTDLGLRHNTVAMEYQTTKYAFGGDSVIGGVSYCNCGECLLREESAEEKVYIFDLDSAREYLLYDFSAQVGDSIYTYSQGHFYENYPIVITAIDTVTDLASNSVRRFWYMAYPYDTADVASYVEGYGAIERSMVNYNGERQLAGGFATELRCWLDNNGSKLMFNGRGSEYLGDDCEGGGTVGVENVEMSDVVVAYLDGMISFSEDVSGVAIIGVDGRVVYAGGEEIVSCINAGLVDGVYFVRFSIDGKDYVERVVVR